MISSYYAGLGWANRLTLGCNLRIPLYVNIFMRYGPTIIGYSSTTTVVPPGLWDEVSELTEQ